MKWCDLETNKKKFQLFNGINAENLELRCNSGISQEYKIDNIIEIKKKRWNSSEHLQNRTGIERRL